VRYISFLVAVIILAVAVPSSADYRELFEKEFLSKPWGSEIKEESACLECHTSDVMDPELQQIPRDWKASWHYKNDVSCHDCHGGDSEDATMAMSHQRGFIGKPSHTEVPQFCGKCHIGILKNYVESGHGEALRTTGKGPNCVTCHGSHNIQKVNIDIINSQRCSQCHSYERAKIIKQALFLTDKKIEKIENELEILKTKGVYPDKEEKSLFDTQAKFRALFHTIDVSIIRDKTYYFTKKLDDIESNLQTTFQELSFRRKFSTYLALLFACLFIVVSLISKSRND
jgi:nitrate/TMAO reductase-like tetraheme cytochrome c subunit